ncbi:MAG: histidinol-phosphate transaminase [Lachnospiraceae bacterium]|nr:histidinol-phosphate transaminase [Lachnospiraceae bacterium]
MGFEENIRKVVPYVPGEQPQRKVIKLNTNECPYPPSKKVVEAWKEFDMERLRLYPDPNAELLVNAWADYLGIERNQVFVGVGSDDVLSVAFLTFFHGKKKILFPNITYSFYDVWADVYEIPYEMKELDSQLRIVKEDYMCENGGIILANPNAPTGTAEDLSVLEEIIKNNQDSVVIIDEAYVDFGAESAISLIDKYENVLIVQTFSKSRALAGLRIGFAMGNKKLIQYMNDVKFSINSYTMNMPSIHLGAKAIEDEEYFREIVTKIVKTREWTKVELKKLGFTFGDSKTNFIFATHQNIPAIKIFEELKNRDIFVRHFNKKIIENFLRISIGTDEEMKVLIETLDNYISKNGDYKC